ncbi:integrase, catalytic region, zinc finger, CCHC-type containing protein [Tanacetum coccineum]
MANILKDIQSVGSNTRPPMLDRSDFASWQQRIRLYCMGKDNRENIIKSIDEGPFKMGKFKETLAEGAEGALHLGPERDRVVADLTLEEKDMYKADIRFKLTKDDRELYDEFEHFRQNKGETIHEYYGRFMKLNRGLKESNYDQLYAYLKQLKAHANENKMMFEKFTQHSTDPLALMSNVSPPQYPPQSSASPQSAYVPPGQQNRGQGNNARGAVTAGNGGVQNRVGNANPGQARQIECYNYNGIGHIARNCTQPKQPLNSEYVNDKMLLMQAQENGVVLDEEQLLFIAGGPDNVDDADVDEPPVQDLALTVDNIFQADKCDTFESDVDEAPTAQTMLMENLSSVDPIYDEAGPSYDSDILSEVQDHDNYQDAVDEHHEVHKMYNDVQPNYVVESDAAYTSGSNVIPYDQYVKDKAEPVVHSNLSSVPNDAYMMIINEMHEQAAQCVSTNEQNKVVIASLTAKLARYKEQVELYKRRARFELTEREQKIDEHLRIIIIDRNIKEESLKKELHSVNMQLNSTINHNKSMVEEVTTLKKDFKQKENKYLKDFLDIKALKEKVEDKLFKQDQSLQTVHMLCKPKPYYDEKKKVAIGYKSPLYLTCAKQVQPALYNGHELVKTNHTRVVVHDSEDTIDITEKTRIGMLEKMKSTLWVDRIPKGLTKEVKEMKEIFKQMEAKVDQNAVEKKSAKIERKNLLIENENLIADCLSKEVFYTAINYVLTVSRFSEMHEAYTLVQARCLELKTKLSKLKHKIQKDDHNEIIKRFSNLEIYYLNLQLKYQNLKEHFGNNKSEPSQDALEFDTVFKINKMKASLQGKDNIIRKLREKISQIKEIHSVADRILDFKAGRIC